MMCELILIKIRVNLELLYDLIIVTMLLKSIRMLNPKFDDVVEMCIN
jgi:hypothetical protein